MEVAKPKAVHIKLLACFIPGPAPMVIAIIMADRAGAGTEGYRMGLAGRDAAGFPLGTRFGGVWMAGPRWPRWKPLSNPPFKPPGHAASGFVAENRRRT
ncbi:hypothetical protein MishRS11D_41830 (plasmid) [Methylomagnum ishizawai]|nr:hypothetical protein MishRS11D_41830 [Methylomagnum ishizawai]